MVYIRQFLLPVFVLMTACACNTQTDGGAPKVSKKDMQGFTSADRAYADVRGKVSHCQTLLQDVALQGDSLVEIDGAMQTLINQTFDANGHIASVVREDMHKYQPAGKSVLTFDFDSKGTLSSSSTDLEGRLDVSRDKNGYVSTFASIDSKGETDFNKRFKWKGDRLVSEEISVDHTTTDGDGKPISVPADKVTYTYDKDGYLLSSTEESGDRKRDHYIIDTSYRNTSYDPKGNWTSRELKHVTRIYTPQSATADTVVTYQIETREITYAP